MAELEVWGGIECTVNRVGSEHFDQLRRSGHDERIGDLDLIAALGIRTLRYPVLWERVERDGWSWADERLERLRELGIRPIVGLVHHGSGPVRTNLLDPGFAAGLAEHAAAAADRYPWVDLWTPVNEPLTTARFSALYGHWYPHARDDLSFARAVLNQCKAVVLAMEAIRHVRPEAQLVQTEDVGKTHSTERLRYQAELENERRWLSFDLLTGTLTPDRRMWAWLVGVGIDPAELQWFVDSSCPPDIVGVNHYLSGERFIDERLDRYPLDAHGGNGTDAYADVLAARVLGAGPDGPATILREAWDRYGLPLAVTEAHNGCTREEQLRWLDEVWRAAHAVRDEGADIRAVTIWSLFGAYGWADLCRSGVEPYEPGVFDLRAPAPRPTALASMARALATEGRYEHPVLETPGWWRRPDRVLYPPRGDVTDASVDGPPLLITGATGTLGQAFARACAERGLAHVLTARDELDLAEPASVAAALERHLPWAVVNTAGYVRVDDAELEPERCFRDNRDGAAVLARACAAHGLPLVTFSSDLVFDGAARRRPYVETDAVRPLNVYGRSKAEAEELVLAAHPRALVIRTSAFFGPHDEHNFVTIALRELAAGREFAAAADVVVSPTYVPDLVDEALDLLIDGETGIWHLAGPDAVSWHELARRAAQVAEIDASPLAARSARELGWIAPRPSYCALASNRGGSLPSLATALTRYVDARRSAPDRAAVHS